MEIKSQLEKAKEALNANIREIRNWEKHIEKFELQITGFEEEEVEPLERYSAEELEEMDVDGLEKEIGILQGTIKASYSF